jgi:glycosyltransferase involved in cell wall biosynthesis
MRLLLLDQFSDPGGAQKNLLELLPAIRAAGWSALVGLPGQGKLFDAVRACGFDTVQIHCGPYRAGRKSLGDFARFIAQTPRLSLQIRGLAKEFDADLIYLNGPRLLPAAALAKLDRPVLFHSHSYLGPGFQRRTAGDALRQLDAWVIGQCEFVAVPWRRFVRSGRISVIYNGVAGPVVAPVRSRTGPPRVGSIGRIAPEKGQLEFVAAAALIRKSQPDCRFVVYGAPLFDDPAARRYDAEVRAAADGLPIDFPGWVEDISACLAELDLLLVPSAGHEATTRVILEAFAAGVPVIAFPSGGIPEVVEDGVTGLLARSPEEISRHALTVLASDTGAFLSRNAREAWSRRFTLDGYRRQMLHAIQLAATTAPRSSTSFPAK